MHVYQVGMKGVFVHSTNEGVYEFITKSGSRCKDKSGNIAKGKLGPAATVTITPGSGGKPARVLFELGRINTYGLHNLENKVKPIPNNRRAKILANLDVTDGY